MDVISIITNLARDVVNSSWWCAVILTLDTLSAFNCKDWDRVKGALASIGISGYMASLIEYYFSGELSGTGGMRCQRVFRHNWGDCIYLELCNSFCYKGRFKGSAVFLELHQMRQC